MFFIRLFSLLIATAVGAYAAANPPLSVTNTPAGCSSVTVTWTAASGNGSSTPTQYEIYRELKLSQVRAAMGLSDDVSAASTAKASLKRKLAT